MTHKTTKKVLIQNRLGLHTRAAVKLVELAQGYDATITISNEESKEMSADSVMALMMLESAQGQYVTISAVGNQSAEALEAVCELIAAKFQEEE